MLRELLIDRGREFDCVESSETVTVPLNDVLSDDDWLSDSDVSFVTDSVRVSSFVGEKDDDRVVVTVDKLDLLGLSVSLLDCSLERVTEADIDDDSVLEGSEVCVSLALDDLVTLLSRDRVTLREDVTSLESVTDSDKLSLDESELVIESLLEGESDADTEFERERERLTVSSLLSLTETSLLSEGDDDDVKEVEGKSVNVCVEETSEEPEGESDMDHDIEVVPL